MVFWSLLLLGMVAFVLMVVAINTDHGSTGWYAATSILAGVAAFIWLGTAITCGRCHHRVGWWYLTHSTAGDWLTHLRHGQQCPVCGDDGRVG